MHKGLTETLPLIARVDQEDNQENEVAVPGDLDVLYELYSLDLLLYDLKLVMFKLLQYLLLCNFLLSNSLLD